MKRFDIVGTIGKGAFGTVVRAHDHQLGHEVAIKVVKLPDDEIVRKRLLREVTVLRRLQHPGIIRMYDSIDSSPDALQLVLELLGGNTLKKALAARGALSESEVSGVAQQLLSAIAHMHDLGIIHRDLKPENIMSTEPFAPQQTLPTTLTWKVFDFGLGRTVPGARASSRTRRTPSLKLSRSSSRGMQRAASPVPGVKPAAIEVSLTRHDSSGASVVDGSPQATAHVPASPPQTPATPLPRAAAAPPRTQ